MAAQKSSSQKDESVAPYLAGLRIPVSGIYQAQHEDHRKPHEITLVQGQFFPLCRTCGRNVRFVPLHTADRLREDYDFNEKIGFPAYAGR